MGNICRSPTAEGVFRQVVGRAGLDGRVDVDSAGTHAYHVGEPPDRRSQAVARERGIDLSGQRARKATPADFERFDYVIAMDGHNLRDLQRLCPPGRADRLHRLMDFAPQHRERDVPDPYYGGPLGFDMVFDMIEDASEGLLDHIRIHHLAP
ncbi:MAG: low molecular weight phosphotyrosine protein phosphatase [Hyphomicrobiales bacterium]|nr:low molecular weight phosphotyrosine protein phosphatase [Hyphomicrobiales bacterium]